MGGILRPAHWAIAFTEASLRRVPVLVVHAAPLAELSPGEQDTRVNLAEILAGWKADYPDIDVDTLLLAGAPRDTVARYRLKRSCSSSAVPTVAESGTLDPFRCARRS